MFAGYEKYNTIRADPALCFLERVGKPDDKAVAAEQRANDYMDGYAHFRLILHLCFGSIPNEVYLFSLDLFILLFYVLLAFIYV